MILSCPGTISYTSQGYAECDTAWIEITTLITLSDVAYLIGLSLPVFALAFGVRLVVSRLLR